MKTLEINTHDEYVEVKELLAEAETAYNDETITGSEYMELLCLALVELQMLNEYGYGWRDGLI